MLSRHQPWEPAQGEWGCDLSEKAVQRISIIAWKSGNWSNMFFKWHLSESVPPPLLLLLLLLSLHHLYATFMLICVGFTSLVDLPLFRCSERGGKFQPFFGGATSFSTLLFSGLSSGSPWKPCALQAWLWWPWLLPPSILAVFRPGSKLVAPVGACSVVVA